MAKKLEDLLREAGISASYTQRNFGQGVGTSSTYEKKKDIPTTKKLYQSMGFSDSQIGTNGPKADTTWKSDLLKPLSTKKYGSSYDKKLNKIFGDPWAAKDFERFMNYRDANKTIQTNAANVANNEWENSHKKSLDNLSSLYAAREASRMTDVSGKASGLELKQLPGQPPLPSSNPLNQQTEKILNEIANKKKYSPQQKEKSFGEKYIADPQKWLYDHTLGPVQDLANRFALNFTDGTTAGFGKDVISKGNKALGMDAPEFVQKAAESPTNGLEKVVDVTGNFAGTAAPIGLMYKPAGWLAKGAMAGKDAKYVEAAIRGGLAMGMFSTAQEAIDALANTSDKTLGDRLANIGINTGLGMVGDPAIVGLGAAGSNILGRFAKGNVPSFTGQASEEALARLAPNQSKSVKSSNAFFDNLINPKQVAPTAPIDSAPPAQKQLLDEFANFAQQGNPKARGLVDKIGSPARYAKEDLSKLADSILSRETKNINVSGANQRLLEIQNEMQASRDRLAMYGKDITPEEAYLKVRKDGDPATFDELITHAIKEADKQAYDQSLPGLLRNDPRIAEELRKLDELGGIKKPTNQPLKTPDEIIQELTKKQNLQSQETLKLPDLKAPNQKPLGNLLSDLKPVNKQPDKSLLETLNVEPKKKLLLSIGDVFGHLKQIDETVPSAAQKPVSKPVTLKTVNTKPLHEMSPEELTKVHEQLVHEHDVKAMSGESTKTIGEDIAKVEQTLKGGQIAVKEGEKKSLLSIGDVFGHLKQVDEIPPSRTSKPVTKSTATSEPVVLKTVKPTKDVNKMSKEELQSIYQQLEKEHKALSKTKGITTKQKIQQVQEDLNKVQGLLMKLDLQLFGKSEPKPITTVENTVSSSPKKKTENPIKEIKDINQFQVGTKNIYELADKLPKQQGNVIRKSLDAAKKNYVTHLEQETNDLYEKVVKNLGIKAGSKESALVQDFGEKTLGKKYLREQGVDLKDVSPEEIAKANLEQLKQHYPDKWKKIVDADQFFREKYDTLIDQVNTVREQIYPNSPDKVVPKRNDYYHHFNELTGFEGVRNLFTNSANIDPHLEGMSPFTQPKTKWQGFQQKRGLGPYKSDAVGGFLKYVRAASHSINVDTVIPVLRKTAKELADATTTSRNANNIIEALVDHANDLAGKTNPYDRVTQKVMGRKGMAVMNWVNSRVRSNMILGNLGTVVAQYGNIPWGIGKAKLHSVPGLLHTIEQSAKELFHFDKSAPIYQSNFMKERYQDHLFRRFDQKLIQQPKKFAGWAMETADKQATRFIWNSMYNKATKLMKKSPNLDPIKYADYETRKLVAGRGVGEVPIMQKSKTFQVFAPFTLEVGNQWKILSEMVGKKDAAGLITALVASYGLNKAAEEIRGSTGVSYDPLGAIIDGYTKQDGNVGDKSLHALASFTGESVGNIPGGNILTQMVNTEKTMPFTDIKYKDVFGERNPNRYGSGLVASKILEDPIAYGLMQFGGSQMRKSTKGIDAWIREGVYKNDSKIPFVGPKDELIYPVKPNAWETLKLPLFGPSATKDAKTYYDSGRKPLTDIQTNAYHRLKKEGIGSELDLYNFLRAAETKPSERGKVTKIEKDEKISDAEKIRRLIELMEKAKK